MSNAAKEALAYGTGILMLMLSIVVAGWIVVQVWSGISGWWRDVTYVSPERQAQIDRQEAEWAKDPRNPKVAGQKCLDLGGIPDYSAWDGDVKACNKPGGGNIDIKQSVEVKP